MRGAVGVTVVTEGVGRGAVAGLGTDIGLAKAPEEERGETKEGVTTRVGALARADRGTGAEDAGMLLNGDGVGVVIGFGLGLGVGSSKKTVSCFERVETGLTPKVGTCLGVSVVLIVLAPQTLAVSLALGSLEEDKNEDKDEDDEEETIWGSSFKSSSSSLSC